MDLLSCRACLATNQDMIPLDLPFVNSYNLLTNLSISLVDEMPQTICQKCFNCVKYCMDFRERCIASEAKLQANLLEVKQEVKSETNDDGRVKLETENEIASFQDEDVEQLSNCIKQEKDKAKQVTKKPSKRRYVRKIKPTIKENEETVSDQQFSCGLCKQQFNERDALGTHIESHKSSLKCELCSEKRDNWPNLVAHRFVHISKKERMCHICNKGSRTSLVMERHYNAKHYEKKKKKFRCNQCSGTYETSSKLKRHVSLVHPKDNLVFICDYCSKIFASKEQIFVHMKLTHGTKTIYPCDICAVPYKTRTGLQQHKIRKHAPVKLTCNKCKRLFTSQEKCDNHKCGGVVKICPVCGIQVKYRFRQHISIHAGIMPYKCTRCPAEYKTGKALKEHLLRHDGKRIEQCEFCPLNFYSKSVLIKHRRVHTGEKPYVCKVCSRGFTGSNNLKVHMKIHGEYLVKKNSSEDVSLFTTPTI